MLCLITDILFTNAQAGRLIVLMAPCTAGGLHRKRDPVPHAHLPHQPRYVGLHRLLANAQRLGNLAIRARQHQLLQNFFLALGKARILPAAA
jgi:hypothetical protein